MKLNNIETLTEELKNLPPLFQHQKQALETTRISDRALIIRGAGSGKTRIGEEILNDVLTKDKFALWICPANLINQTSKSLSNVGFTVSVFSKETRLIKKGTVTIASYDMVKRYVNTFTSLQWDVCIVDEFHRTRNKGTVVNEATWKIQKNCKKLYALTATPFNNTQDDFFELLSIVVGQDIVKKLKKSIRFKEKRKGLFASLLRMFFGKKKETDEIQAKIIWNKKNILEVFSTFVDYAPPESYLGSIQRPTANTIIKDIELSYEEVKQYDEIYRNKNIKNKEMAYRQILLSDNSSKIKTAIYDIKNILKNPDRKIIVFSNFVESGLGSLEKALQSYNIPYKIFKGDNSPVERNTIEKEFAEGKISVLLISPSGFEGLDLKGTTDCIVLDPHYNPAKTEQIVSRGLRAGSSVKEVNIYHYKAVSSKLKIPTIDEKILSSAKKKEVKNTAMEKMIGDTTKKKELKEEASPFSLDTLSSLKTFLERIRYCDANLKKLGAGSSRIVYSYNEKTVLKLAKNSSGISQNSAENDYIKQKYSCMAKVKKADPEDKWILMEAATKAKERDFLRLMGVPFTLFQEFMRFKDAENSGKRPKNTFSPEDFRKLSSNKTLQELQNLILDFDMPIGDLLRTSSWGIVQRNKKEKLVVIDYGFDRDAYQEKFDKVRNHFRGY
jgi:superfamily II DNA or RNA helicase